MSGIDGPSYLVALTDEDMLHDLLLSFAAMSPRMVTILFTLHAGLTPTIGVELPVARQLTTAPSHLRLTIKYLHSMTAAWPSKTARLDDFLALTLGCSHQAQDHTCPIGDSIPLTRPTTGDDRGTHATPLAADTSSSQCNAGREAVTACANALRLSQPASAVAPAH